MSSSQFIPRDYAQKAARAAKNFYALDQGTSTRMRVSSASLSSGHDE